MSSEKVVQFADLGIYPYDDVGLSGFGDDLDFVTFGVFGVVAIVGGTWMLTERLPSAESIDSR